jgi:hypothetical protein
MSDNFNFDDDFDFDNTIEHDKDAFSEFDDELGISNDDEETETNSGRSPVFWIIMGILLIGLVAGGALLFVTLNPGGNPDLAVTRTAIADANATTEALIRATNDQATAYVEATLTAEQATATPFPTNTPDFTATAAIDQITQTAESNLALTATAMAGVEETIDPVLAAQQTATALAGLFDQTPTIAATPDMTDLPDTGLFDDIGAENAGLFFMMAFGLVGIIIGSRRLRKHNK